MLLPLAVLVPLGLAPAPMLSLLLVLPLAVLGPAAPSVPPAAWLALAPLGLALAEVALSLWVLGALALAVLLAGVLEPDAAELYAAEA